MGCGTGRLVFLVLRVVLLLMSVRVPQLCAAQVHTLDCSYVTGSVVRDLWSLARTVLAAARSGVERWMEPFPRSLTLSDLYDEYSIR